jgi:hypothetical protein
VESDSTHQALKLLGQSIGIVSLGRRIVLIEGANASLDKQAYGLLLRNRFPNLVLVPAGGKDDIRAFGATFERVLSKTIWGVEFFMLCDRDAANADEIARLEAASQGRLRFLKRYHLENYFLEANVLSALFEETEPAASWLRSPTEIDTKLREVAAKSVSYAAALIVAGQVRREVGNVDILPKGVHDKSVNELVASVTTKVAEEALRSSRALDNSAIEALVRSTYGELERVIKDPSDQWKVLIPGRPVLAQFASAARMDAGRLKLAFLNRVVREKLSTFDDVLAVFAEFERF